MHEVTEKVSVLCALRFTQEIKKGGISASVAYQMNYREDFECILTTQLRATATFEKLWTLLGSRL